MSDVVHVRERSRFEVVEGESTAVLTYVREGDAVRFEHTRVPAEIEGEGIGTELAAAGLGWARSEGLVVVPQCSFVRAYLDEHPEVAAELDVR